MSEQPFTEAQRQQAIEDARQRALAAGGQMLTPEQAAAATAPAAADPGLGVGVDQISAAQQAAPAAGQPLPYEAQMNALMEQLKAQSEQLAVALGRVGDLEKHVQAVTAQASAAQGLPYVVRYAQGARDKLLAHAIANADLGGVRLVPSLDQATGETVLRHQAAGHFESVLHDADQLAAAAVAAAKGDAPAQAVTDAAARVIRFIERTHRRLTPKYIDYSAALDDLDATVEEALKLTPAA
jgi:hypothetical protein